MTLKARVKKSSNVNRAARKLRKSKYDPILARIEKLEPGKALTITPPKGVTARQLATRMSSIIQARKKQELLSVPKGYSISCFETDEGDLGIELKKQ